MIGLFPFPSFSSFLGANGRGNEMKGMIEGRGCEYFFFPPLRISIF